jgi:hypothetical protein
MRSASQRQESMDETKQRDHAYSTERLETTSVQAAQDTSIMSESSAVDSSGQPSKQPQKSLLAAILDFTKSGEYSSVADFSQFLKRTGRVWLSLAAAILGLMAVVTLVEHVSDWARNARERRHERAVASVTPERLIARCGQPAEDTTTEVYPILMRTMSYQPRNDEKLVMAFSRTAEEKSDWVFLSMKDENEPRSYDTPDAEIDALPCLDSKR